MYINNMIVKSTTSNEHLLDLKVMFGTLRKCNITMNSNNCTFRVSAKTFMGFIINEKGIETNLERVKFMPEIKRPQTVKEVQKLTRCIIVLGRFISNSAQKCLPCFKCLRSIKDFRWTKELRRPSSSSNGT